MGDATYNAMVAAGTFDDLEAFAMNLIDARIVGNHKRESWLVRRIGWLRQKVTAYGRGVNNHNSEEIRKEAKPLK